MNKSDAKRLLAEADVSGRVHRIKPGWKGFTIFAGVLVCLLIILIPLGIWFFVVAKRARIALGEEGFVVCWFKTAGYRWEDIEAFRPVSFGFHIQGGGLVGALVGAAASAAVSARTQGLKGPLSFKLKGKRMYRQLPAHQVLDSIAMAEEMERRTGLSIFPPKEPAEAPAV